MKTYTVLKFTDAIHCKEDKTFSSFTKAIHYIENLLSQITAVGVEKNGHYFTTKWYYKEYYTDIEWAQILLNKKDIEHTYYRNHKISDLIYSYGIKVTEIY